jgi:hypothetical protein
MPSNSSRGPCRYVATDFTHPPNTQVSPNFAYAYTLLAHEYVLVEELEKALACFRCEARPGVILCPGPPCVWTAATTTPGTGSA